MIEKCQAAFNCEVEGKLFVVFKKFFLITNENLKWQFVFSLSSLLQLSIDIYRLKYLHILVFKQIRLIQLRWKASAECCFRVCNRFDVDKVKDQTFFYVFGVCVLLKGES